MSLDAPSPGGFDDSKEWVGRFRIKSVKPVGADGDTMDDKSAKAEALKRAASKY